MPSQGRTNTARLCADMLESPELFESSSGRGGGKSMSRESASVAVVSVRCVYVLAARTRRRAFRAIELRRRYACCMMKDSGKRNNESASKDEWVTLSRRCH